MAIGVDDGWSAADPTKNIISRATPYNSPHLFGDLPNPAGWVNLRVAEEEASYNAQIAALTGIFADQARQRSAAEAAIAGKPLPELIAIAAAGTYSNVQAAAPGAAAAAPVPVKVAAAAVGLWLLLEFL